MTPHPWVSPVELLTLGALFTPKAVVTVTLACELYKTETDEQTPKVANNNKYNLKLSELIFPLS